MNTQQRAIKDMAAALAHAEELLPNDVVVMNGAAVGRWLLEQPVQELLPKCTHDWVSNTKEKWCLRCGAQETYQFAGAGKAIPPAQPADQPDYEFHYRQLLEKPEPVQEPVAFKVIKGELCYKSQEDDQSFGMWCPVTPQTDLPYVNGTEFYTTPPAQPAALSLEDSLRVTKVCCGDYANCHAPCTPRGRWQAQPAAWVGLTQREWDDLWDEHHDEYGYQLSADGYERAIEQRLKEKNT
jgi:hypothetical protein